MACIAIIENLETLYSGVRVTFQLIATAGMYTCTSIGCKTAMTAIHAPVTAKKPYNYYRSTTLLSPHCLCLIQFII